MTSHLDDPAYSHWRERAAELRAIAEHLEDSTSREAQRLVRWTLVLSGNAQLEAAGVEFIDENGGGAGVRLRKPSKKR